MDGLLIFTLLLFGYFLPALIAYETKKPNAHAIMAVNLFLGWTLIGWVVALAWSLVKDSSIAK